MQFHYPKYLLEKSASLDTELKKIEKTKKNHLQKQQSLELNLKIDKNENKKLKKSRTSGLYMASSKNVTFDRLSDLSDKEDEAKPLNKLFESADQVLFKQRLEQRLNTYKKKGAIKFCIGNEQGTEKGQFKWPRDVRWVKYTLKTELISQQKLLVADSGNCRIQTFDTQGRLIDCFGENEQGENKFSCPTSVVTLPDGTFIVSDSDLNRLQWFDHKGQFIKQIGNKNLSNNQPNENQLDLNASTSSIISNFMKNLSETNLKRQTSTDPGEFSAPYGLCYDQVKNELLVCDKGNQRIQVLDASNGAFKRFLCSNYKSSTRLNTGNQLTFKSPNFIDSNGKYIIISDTNSHCVHRINLQNGIEMILGGEGTSAGKLKYPRGVAIDDMNFSIIADSGNNRVVVFSPEGNFLKRLVYFFYLFIGMCLIFRLIRVINYITLCLSLFL